MNPKNNDCNIMILTGSGKVTAVPDIAVLRLGVQTNGDNLTEVQAENARISQIVLQALYNMGITDIKTFDYSIDKVYDYVNGQRIDRGYTVRNILEIRMTDMEQVGSAIDAAVESGANVADFISFDISDASSYYLQALNLAVLNAYRKARSISQELRLTLDPVPVKITENTAVPAPYPQYRTFREGAAVTTPIEPGNKQIEASVTVEFIY